MRVGINPNRKLHSDSFAPVFLTCVVHLPNFEGYHEHRFEVVQTCLKSMVQNCDAEHTLVIWDNGSHPLVREWIQDEMRPEIFVQSINLGKTGGRTSITRAIPAYHVQDGQRLNTVFCYSDDDMYFYPGWLKPQLELLNHFPNAACVTGYPVRTSFRWGNTKTVAWARQNADVAVGRFLPQQWEDDFAVSIGRDVQLHRQQSQADQDILITYNGVQAYATSHHCQFIAFPGRMSHVLTYDGYAMGDEKPFDEMMDKIGLRLATTQRYTRHIGNVLHDELRQEIEAAESIKMCV